MPSLSFVPPSLSCSEPSCALFAPSSNCSAPSAALCTPSESVLMPTNSCSTTLPPTELDTAEPIASAAFSPSMVGMKPLVSFSVMLIFAECGSSSFTLVTALEKSVGISKPR